MPARSRALLISLIVAIVPMAVLAMQVSRHLPALLYSPTYIWPEPPTIQWSMAASNLAMPPNSSGRALSEMLDLRTGLQTRLPYAPYQIADRNLDGSVVTQQFKPRGNGLDLVRWSADGKSSRQLFTINNSMGVINHRFLISTNAGRLIAFDLNQDRSQAGIDICEVPFFNSPEDLREIEGSDQFLLTGKKGISIYSLADGRAKEICNWTTGGMASLAVLRAQKIFSLATDNKSMEVRDTQTLQIEKIIPLPTPMIGEWNSARFGHALVTILHPQSGEYESYWLENLERVPELKGLEPLVLPYRAIGHPRFHLFNDAGQPRRELVVFDAHKLLPTRHINLDHDYCYVRAVADDKLVVVDFRYGLTCKVFDLNTSQCIAIYRPLQWTMICVVMLNVLAIAWVIGWLRFSARAKLPAIADWLVLGLVIVLPVFVRAWSMTWLIPSPSMTMFHACVLLSLLAAGFHLWNGTNRWAYRLAMILLLLAGLANLLMVREWQQRTTSQTAITIVWTHLATAAVLFSAMVVPIATSRRLGAIDLRSASGSPAYKVKTKLSDMFVLTAAVAILLGSAIPMKVNAYSVLDLVQRSHVLSLLTITPMMLGAYLFLSRWKVMYWLGMALAVATCLVLVGQWVLDTIDLEILIHYIDMTAVPRVSFCYLVAGAWAWHVRVRRV